MGLPEKVTMALGLSLNHFDRELSDELKQTFISKQFLITLLVASGFVAAQAHPVTAVAANVTAITLLAIFTPEQLCQLVKSLGKFTDAVRAAKTCQDLDAAGKIWSEIVAEIVAAVAEAGFVMAVTAAGLRLVPRVKSPGKKRVSPSDGSTSNTKPLLDELTQNGVKFSPDKVVQIGRDVSGRVVFLEEGNSKAGLQHIIERHGADFARQGISEAQIPDAVMAAATRSKQVGMQGTRPIFEVSFCGKTYRIAVTISDNGFIVGANPAGS